MKRLLVYFARVWRQPAKLRDRQQEQARRLEEARIEMLRVQRDLAARRRPGDSV